MLAVYLLFAKGSGPNAFLTALRFALAFALLLAPTAMMGATLSGARPPIRPPLLGRRTAGRFSLRRQHVRRGRRRAACRLRADPMARRQRDAVRRGSRQTSPSEPPHGTAARRLPQPDEEEAPPDAEPAETFSPSVVNASAAAFGISGFCALAYEVFWTRILVFFLGSTTYAFATMLAAFLTGIAFGSAVLSRFLPRIRRPALALGAVQALIGIASVLSLPIISEMNAIVRGVGFGGRPMVFAVCVFVMLGPTFLMGASFSAGGAHRVGGGAAHRQGGRRRLCAQHGRARYSAPSPPAF